jgi:hypothetical protein
MNKVLDGATKTLALVPGLAVLVTGFGVPPVQNGPAIFGGVMEILGILTLLLLAINKVSIQKMDKLKITRIGIGCGISVIFAVIAYAALLALTVVTHQTRGQVVFPLYLSGDIQQMVDSAGSRIAAIEKYGITSVYQATIRTDYLSRALTTALLVLTYSSVVVLAVLATGFPSTYLAKSES